MSKRTEWTKEQQENAVIEYSVRGSYVQTSKALSIPRKTIADWVKSEWGVLLTLKVRHEKQRLHIAKYNQMVDLAQDKAIELIPGIKSAKEATLVACMAQDKGQLLQGLPTSNNSNQDNRALAEACKELSRTMRDHGVVSVQTRTKTEE